MASIMLCCGIFGEDTLFTVAIPQDARIMALRDAVFDAMPPSDYLTEASMLRLFLAWKDGAWIKSDTRVNTEDFVSEPVDQPLIFMNLNDTLSVYLAFGRCDNDERGVVHVMIQRPPSPRVVLCCGVFGEDTLFTVAIPCDARTATLQDTVFDAMPRSDYPTKPSMLNLYLAGKHGAWIKSSTRIKAENFPSEPVDQSLTLTNPNEKLRVYLAMGRYDKKERGVVHVMIRRPPRIVLCCGVFGEATQIFVPVPHDGRIATLQDAAFGMMTPSDYLTKPSMLKLYLAWKDGAWIKSDTRIKTDGEDFAGETVDPAFTLMNPNEKLSVYLASVRYDNDERGVVHMMVQRPRRSTLCGDEPPATHQHVEEDMPAVCVVY